MTDESAIHLGHPDGPETADDDAPQADAGNTPAAAPGGSLLGQLHQSIGEAAEDATKILPVGKIPRLFARYRALTPDEQDDLQKRAEQQRKLRKRVSRTEQEDGAGSTERHNAAVLLATACVELLWLNDAGDHVPLAEALAADGVDVVGPLRYDRDAARLFDLAEVHDLSTPPTIVEIVTALHTWGRGAKKSTAPLMSAANVLNLWLSAVDADALEEVLEGN